MKRSCLGILLLSSIYGVTNAQEIIIADRPGFSTGTYIVQPGNYNIEMGYNYTFDKSSSQNDTQDFPLFELRTGVTQNIEFDLLWDGYNTNKDFSKKSSSDITLGGKYRVVSQEKYNITLMALVTLPTGSQSTYKTENISPLIGLLWDYSLGDNYSLFGTLQASTYLDENRIYDFQPAVGITIEHTEKFASFLEIYSILPSSSLIAKEYLIDGGFTYLIQKNIQIDINGGIGLNKNSNDFLGCGIAIAF